MNLFRDLLFGVLSVTIASWVQASPGSAPTQFEKDCQHWMQTQGHESDSKRFSKFLDLSWKHTLKESPEFSTFIGESGGADHWTDWSPSAREERRRELDCPIKAMESIHRSKLSPADQLSYDLFYRNAKIDQEGSRFPWELLQISPMGGAYQQIPSILISMPTDSLSDYNNILTRLEKAPELLDQHVALFKEALEKKVFLPKITLKEVPAGIMRLMPSEVEKSDLFKPFLEIHSSIAEKDQKALKEKAVEVIHRQVYPALQRYYDFIVQNYIPQAPEQIGWENMPDGKAWYAYQVKVQTTTQKTSEEIHQIGLAEVARIRKEMDEALVKSGFDGDLKKFKEFLRTDPQFFYTSADDLLAGFRNIAKKADPELVHLFGKLPRTPYGIKAVPSYAEKSVPTGYYEAGSLEAGRPGYFFGNTYDLKSRAKWEMEALVLHESVPGHHLQISIAQEIENIPKFRKYMDNNAYVEGWGLYAESLGKEMGFYQDPYSNFGRLSFEMWRACRLVVDTGIHHLGWSRDQAIQLMMDNTAKSLHDVEVEVDRYIVTPGQALSYKMGELTYKHLRQEAKSALGDRFSVKKFHDAVLAEGALPLELLETRIRTWIQKQEK